MPPFPTYAQLDRPDDTGMPLAWGLWGAEDEIGTLNHITPERVRDAARLIRRGLRYSLDLPLHLPFAAMKAGAHKARSAPVPTMFRYDDGERIARDDKLDNFFLQGSTQWDSLTHIGDPLHGFYNGVRADQVHHGEGSRNGIDKVAAFGLAGRGVVIDLVRWFAKTGRPWRPLGQDVAGPADLDACLKDQGTAVAPGDILLVRMGWVGAFKAAADEEARDALFRPLTYSGLSGEEAMWAWLWDRKVAAVAADNVAVELFPLRRGRPSLHLAIARLGLTLGELFDLDALAEDCAREGDWTCFFAASPLKLRGGVGSPGNAMAIR